MKIGDKIRRIRDLKGLKQEEVAALLKITPQAYSKVERNETKLDTERLEEIAKIFNMSVDEIQQFDEKNLFFNNMQECKESPTINNINYYYNHDQKIIDSLLQQQKEMITILKDEILFLRQQLEQQVRNGSNNPQNAK
jgi:transcriptional regulator with XRE-family HTH domain